MNKNFFLIAIFVLASVIGVQAQSLPFFDDCSTYTPFELNPQDNARDWNWTMVDNDTLGTYVIEGYAHPNGYEPHAFIAYDFEAMEMSYTVGSPSGNPVLATFASAVPTPNPDGLRNDDWLISPELNGTGNSYTISFWAASYNDRYGLEKFQVKYSTTTNDLTAFTNNVTLPYVQAATEWTEYSYEIPAEAKYVAVNVISCDVFVFFIDDIRIKENFQVEVEATALGVPDYSCALTTAEPIQMLITNNGGVTATNFTVAYQIGNNAPVTETCTASIPAGGELIYTFTTPADLTFDMDEYDVRGWVSIANDGYAGNDTTDWYGTGIPAPQTVPSFTDFTNEEEYKGWTTFDGNGDEGNYPYTWLHVDYDGNMMWRYIGDADDGEGHIGQNANDWLFTSCYDLQPGTYTFKFNYAGYDYAYTESFKLYWGEEPTVAGMTNHIADYNNVINTVFARASHNITITEAGIYYFGFKATSLANNAYLFIDEVSLDVAAEQELTILEVNAPEISCTLTGEETISIVVRNDGTEPVTTFEAEYTIGNTPAVTETATDVNIAPGATYTYTFTTPADLTIPAIDTLYAAVMVGEDNVDVFPENVLVGSAFSVTTYPDTNKFSDDIDNIGWVSIDDKMDGNRWRPIIFNSDKCWINEGFNVLAQIPAEESHDWLLSSCYDLEAGEYTVKFDYCVYNPSYTADLKLYYGTEREINMTNQIWGNSQISNTEYSTSSTVLEIPTAGTYYFGFLAFAQQYLFMDNFVILEGEEEEPVDPTSINDVANNSADITLYPNPANSYIQLNSNETMNQIAIFDMFGKQITTEEVNATTANISVANLSVGMYMAKIYTENGVTVKKFSKM